MIKVTAFSSQRRYKNNPRQYSDDFYEDFDVVDLTVLIYSDGGESSVTVS